MFNYRCIPSPLPNSGTVCADFSSVKRSGHLSHALAEFAPGCVISFWSNCSGWRNKYGNGHNGYGWLEYAVSRNWGDSWSDPRVLPYSLHCFLREPWRISCEKAVSPRSNRVVAFLTRTENPWGWEPYLSPFVLISDDGGESWREPCELCTEKGRVYDAFADEGRVYVIMLANDDFLASKPEHRYKVFVSVDAGESFSFLSEIPGDCIHRAYGSFSILRDGAFIFYAYNQDDEFNLDCWISRDKGATWSERSKSYCVKRIRNPQVARVKGGYLLHGRSGCMGKELPMRFVLYTSEDGLNWDEGRWICELEGPAAYYSNNLVLDRPNGSQRVIVQASVPYDPGAKGRVNVSRWILEIS